MEVICGNNINQERWRCIAAEYLYTIETMWVLFKLGCYRLKTFIVITTVTTKKITRDFPGGPVVKNLSANAEDMGSIPLPPGKYYMPWSN